ncbi:MAG: DEAD/DEAH box helicase family protein [Candidatus Peribacteria bacterium]|jgi:type III restriction enzyme|nr:DEAD/DEAH box helicase family protein [Candidatus Peribacteria bacterium]
MKIQFDANQDYQQQAIHSIVDLFEGVNPVEIALFSQPSLKNKRNLIELSEEISANNLDVERYEDLIVQNMQKIQTENGLETEAKPDTANFSIEMETGTGKTYVYLRTIFELHQYY